MEAVFLGDYQAVRASVYAASAHGQPYPLTTDEWIAASTRGIDSIIAVSDGIGEEAARISRQQAAFSFANVLLILGGLAVLGLAVVASVLVARRLGRRLSELREAAERVAQGNFRPSGVGSGERRQRRRARHPGPGLQHDAGPRAGGHRTTARGKGRRGVPRHRTHPRTLRRQRAPANAQRRKGHVPGHLQPRPQKPAQFHRRAGRFDPYRRRGRRRRCAPTRRTSCTPRNSCSNWSPTCSTSGPSSRAGSTCTPSRWTSRRWWARAWTTTSVAPRPRASGWSWPRRRGR